MKPSIPKGTRDFLPEQVIKRNFIFDTIRRVFVKYGYLPIETPVMENLSTLTGKYGEEGDRLLFKVLNNGDFLAKADETALAQRDSNALIASISKRGLRYDLTVPFARYVVMYQNDLAFPFKRYAIAPVWRADRPQKGRYQEFYQCDVDVVGSNSLMYEAELVQIYDEVFSKLNIPVVIRVNNRKVLKGIAEVVGAEERFIDFVAALDKLDKIGIEGIRKELLDKNFDEESIKRIESFLSQWVNDTGLYDSDFMFKQLDKLENALKGNEIGKLGNNEVRKVMGYLSNNGFSLNTENKVVPDATLARGLGYYTGCIFEVVVDKEKCPQISMGSIGGGGRYDDLTGIFGMPGMSGVGISFGAERIYDVMEELNLFPEHNPESLSVLIMALNEVDDHQSKLNHDYAFKVLTQLRAAGINADLYPEPAKLKKQMNYANARKVPYVILIGGNEMQTGNLAFKNMESGEQQSLHIEKIIAHLLMS